MLKNIALIIFVIIGSTSNIASGQESKKFVTNIQCKYIKAEVVSTCAPTQDNFGAIDCSRQSFRMTSAKKLNINQTIFKEQKKGSGIYRYAYSWQCFKGKQEKEYVTLKIGNWTDNQDEDVYVFDSKGHLFIGSRDKGFFESKDWISWKSHSSSLETASGHIETSPIVEGQ